MVKRTRSLLTAQIDYQTSHQAGPARVSFLS